MTTNKLLSSIVIDQSDGAGARSQIESHVEYMIAIGAFRPGERVPTAVQLAAQLGVSFRTVQRAYDELGSHGTLVGLTTLGTSVAAEARSPELLHVVSHRDHACDREGRGLGLHPQGCRSYRSRRRSAVVFADEESDWMNNREEPWNLPPIPSWCGTSALEWAKQTPEQRKAEWIAQPPWWHESVDAQRIAYWTNRNEMKSEYQWTLDPMDVRNAIVMLGKGTAIERVTQVKGVSVPDLRRDIAMLKPSTSSAWPLEYLGVSPDIRRRPSLSIRWHSSDGQSARPITGRTEVQVLAPLFVR